MAPALTWRIGTDTRVTFLGRYQHDDDHMGFPLPAKGTVFTNRNGEIPITRFIGDPSNRNPVSEINKLLGYQLEHRFSDAVALYQNVRADWYDQRWDRLLYPAFLSPDERTLYRYPLSYRAQWSDYAADTGLRVVGRLGRAQHHLVTGVDYFRNAKQFSEDSIDFSNASSYMALDLFHPVYGMDFSPMRFLASGDTRTQSVGVYLQDRVKLLDRLSVTAGGRADFASHQDFSLH